MDNAVFAASAGTVKCRGSSQDQNGGEPGFLRRPDSNRHSRRHTKVYHIQIRLPKIDELAARWWQVSPLLKRATDRSGGTYAPEDVLREVFGGVVGIWFVEDENEDLIAVAVAGVRQFPQKRVVQISFVAGKRLAEWWPEWVERMDQLARESGATAIYAYGRPGWIRFWKARGVAQHVTSEMLVRTL